MDEGESIIRENRRGEEFSNLAIGGRVYGELEEQEGWCRRSKNENALPRRLLSPSSRGDRRWWLGG